MNTYLHFEQRMYLLIENQGIHNLLITFYEYFSGRILSNITLKQVYVPYFRTNYYPFIASKHADIRGNDAVVGAIPNVATTIKRIGDR